MKCKHFLDDFGGICIATASVYIPDRMERVMYCLNSQHTLCPVFLRMELIEKRSAGCAPSGCTAVKEASL